MRSWLFKICDSSLLRAGDYRMKNMPLGSKMCSRCDLSKEEDTLHFGMQCPATQDMSQNVCTTKND